MDKFLALTEEKRLTILNAAFQCFGKFGYEKASINDIAVAAHISKASVFQYFGSKKQLYIYLLEYCKKIIEGLFDKEALDSETDLFDRILASSRMKMEGLQNQPFILQFITSAWEENSPEVTDTLAILTAVSYTHLFHGLRRRLAKKLLVTGTPLTTITQILGHDDPKSARQYLSLDTRNLKECALDFKGIPLERGLEG